MTKTHTPFLSFASHGSLGKVLTTQDTKHETHIKSYAVPHDPRSLAQLYQRWLYQDYVAYWNTLTPAEKLYWRKVGSKRHLTQLAAFLRFHLRTQVDIIGHWPLDYIESGTTPDISNHARHATNFGATIAPGTIDHAMEFTPPGPFLAVTNPFTYLTHFTAMCFATRYGNGQNGIGTLINKDDNAAPEFFWIYWTDAGDISFSFAGGGINDAFAYSLPTLNTTYHIAITFRPNLATLSVNGQLVASHPTAVTRIDCPAGDLFFGNYAPWPFFGLNGKLDDIILYFRDLDTSEILPHALRRFP